MAAPATLTLTLRCRWWVLPLAKVVAASAYIWPYTEEQGERIADWYGRIVTERGLVTDSK